jgi:hypothetical protein
MRSLDVDLANAVARGEISVRQAATHATDRSDVVSLIRKHARERRRILREQSLGDRRPGVLRAIPNT